MVASWAPEFEWKKARIVKTFKAAAEVRRPLDLFLRGELHCNLGYEPMLAVQLQSLIIDVGEEVSGGYTKAGQFIQIRVEDRKPGFFAIASPPGSGDKGALELLVKGVGVTGTTAELLVQLKEGELQVEQTCRT